MRLEILENARRKLNFLNDQVLELKVCLPRTFTEYEQNRERQLAIERLCQLSVESAHDTCEVLIKGLGKTAPTNMWDTLRKAHAEGMLDSVVLQRFAVSFLGFRNILVHAYEKIENREVFNTAKTMLRHLPNFVAQVRAFIDAQNQPGAAQLGARTKSENRNPTPKTGTRKLR